MPMYEYVCKEGHVTERFRPMAESDKAIVCEDCKRGDGVRRKAERVISQTGAPILKGGGVGGFYSPTT